MKSVRRDALIAMVLLLASSAVRAEPAAGAADSVQASLLADVDAASPGQAFTLGVRLKMKPHWHTYWINPGEYGTPTRIKLTGPAGLEFGEVQWPLPSKIDAPGGISYGYEDEVLLLVPVKVSRDVPAGGNVALAADVSWLSCKEECIPGKARLTLTLPVRADDKGSATGANRELFETWRKRLPVAKGEAAASESLAAVEQPSGASLAVRWKQAPKKVEWFPVSTNAVAIEDVVVKHEGERTQIAFKPTVYKPEQVPGGRVDGVLVYEDAEGKRHGVSVPVTVAIPKGES